MYSFSRICNQSHFVADGYGVQGTPLSLIPPEIPPHAHPLPPVNPGGRKVPNSLSSLPSREPFCEQIAVVNMSLNQCAPGGQKPSDFAPCEHEPLLGNHGAPSSMGAHVLQRAGGGQTQQLRNLQQTQIGQQQQQPRLHQQQCKQHHQSRSSNPSKHHHMHLNHHEQQQSSLPQPSHHHHPHHHHHQPGPRSSSNKWPVSSHFPDWDQREMGRPSGGASSSWKTRSAHSRSRQHPPEVQNPRKHQCSNRNSEIETSNHMGLILPSLPKHYQVEEAGVRNKLRNLTRHYSDDSLQGSSNKELYSTRIHSSADEISSVNRSPSISSSDESFSRTDFSRTDADSPSPGRAPSLNDVRFKYMFGDMNAEARTTPRFRDASPQLYSDYLSSVKASSDESSLRLNSLTLDSSNHLNVAGSWRESDIGPPLTDGDRLRRDDLFIPKLTAEFSSDKVKRTKTDPGRHESCAGRSSVSPLSDKGRSSLSSSFNENDLSSQRGSAGRLMSLDRSPRGAGIRTPDSLGAAVSKRRSLPRDHSRRHGASNSDQQFGGRKSSSMREYDRNLQKAAGERKDLMENQKSEPYRPTHYRKSSGDFDMRSKKMGKNSPFEGILEDQQVQERYDLSPPPAGGSCYHFTPPEVVEKCPSESPHPQNHLLPSSSPLHSSPCSPEVVPPSSCCSSSTLENYSALQKLAKLQEDALLSSLEKKQANAPNILQIPASYDYARLVSYEPGEAGSLLR